MKKLSLLFYLFLFSFGISGDLQAQLALSYTDTITCPGQALQMCAAVTGTASSLQQDDKFTAAIDIGFPFVFFGNTYTQCVASDNNFLSFDINHAGMHSNYQWFGPTSPAFPNGEVFNSICLGFLDAYLVESGVIRYQSFGTPGNRKFIVEWCDVAKFFNCSANHFTNQVILYEGSNNIEVYTKVMPGTPACPTTDPGRAVQGVLSVGGTAQFYTPGRGPNDLWGATQSVNKAVRFTPNGTGTYDIDTTIAYDPWIIIEHLNVDNIRWYAEGEPNLPVGTGACADVVTNHNVNYYVANYTGPAGCGSDTLSFTDTVHIHFGTTQTTVQAEICSGSSYNWLGENLFAAGTYDTLFRSDIACDSFVRLELQVNPLPDVSISGSPNVQICDGSTANLALLNPEEGSAYQWNKEGIPITGETSTSYHVNQAGRYTITATTVKGCIATSQPFAVVVNPNPVATIQPLSSEIMCTYDTVQLVAAAGPSYDYVWSPAKVFRPVSGPEGQTVRGIFDDPVTEVTLTVFNQFGCYDSDTTTVMAKPCCEVFFPSAFTPNGDGLNDYLNPVLKPSQIIVDFRVYDRYGKLVYNNDDSKHGWSGRYPNDEEANAGTYMYAIKYTCADGRIYNKKGDVTLLR